MEKDKAELLKSMKDVKDYCIKIRENTNECSILCELAVECDHNFYNSLPCDWKIRELE